MTATRVHPRAGAIGPGSVRYELEIARRPPRILLADDDNRLRELLASVLRRDGFEVIEAADGGELLEHIGDLILRPPAGSAAIDLVIADICMPLATGLDVLAGLRHADWATPFILMTAFADDETRREAARLGAALVFDKPFDLDDLRIAALHWARP